MYSSVILLLCGYKFTSELKLLGMVSVNQLFVVLVTWILVCTSYMFIVSKLGQNTGAILLQPAFQRASRGPAQGSMGCNVSFTCSNGEWSSQWVYGEGKIKQTANFKAFSKLIKVILKPPSSFDHSNDN